MIEVEITYIWRSGNGKTVHIYEWTIPRPSNFKFYMQHDALVEEIDKLFDPTGEWDLIKRSFLEEDSRTHFPRLGEEMIDKVALILRIKIGCYSVIGFFILSLNIPN